MQLLGIYPVGNLVKLNSGEIAIVLQVHAPDPYRPKVRVLFASDGGRLELPHDVNLWEAAQQRKRRRRHLRHRAAQSRRLRHRSAVIHLIADILVRPIDERGSFGPLCPSEEYPCRASTRSFRARRLRRSSVAGSSRITGQAPVENGRSIALAAAEDTLPAALERVDAMLTSGELNISQLHDDTMIPGRAIERLGQYYEGLPVFGGQRRAPDGWPRGRQRDRTAVRVARPRRRIRRSRPSARRGCRGRCSVQARTCTAMPRSASCRSKADTASSIA